MLLYGLVKTLCDFLRPLEGLIKPYKDCVRSDEVSQDHSFRSRRSAVTNRKSCDQGASRALASPPAGALDCPLWLDKAFTKLL